MALCLAGRMTDFRARDDSLGSSRAQQPLLYSIATPIPSKHSDAGFGYQVAQQPRSWATSVYKLHHSQVFFWKLSLNDV
ncbi:hypothetical protein CH063_08312 [Colletotrichum higginsianum]|uniref:Uncharacterized protein n=1 Tax=Colletotrichum higginsianum (strain IMI 349063) TaxID=759273 RepID=H1V9D4_COLHI|nr:hypothetical protein CH063_08312 [Colletotrichum higginsianum]